MIPFFITQLFAILISLIGISLIIVFHEFGHYIFCKLFNVHTPTFSIGIGKKLFSKKIGDTDFCISAGPIGGYVEVASENGINGSLGFNQIPYYQKVLIMLGGIAFNFVLSYVFFVGLFWTGMPENATGPYEPCTTTISTVSPNSKNTHILQENDILISLNNQSLNNDLTIARKIILEQANKTKEINAEILRNNENITTSLHLTGESAPLTIFKQLDISFQQKPALNLYQSIIYAFKATIFYTQAIIKGLQNMIQARTTKDFAGPLMAVTASSKSAIKGFSYLIFFLAIISINLGFMNLLPLPIFDGGQFVIFSIETLIQKQLSETIRNIIGMSSWILSIGLLIIFTIRDLYNLIF